MSPFKLDRRVVRLKLKALVFLLRLFIARPFETSIIILTHRQLPYMSSYQWYVNVAVTMLFPDWGGRVVVKEWLISNLGKPAPFIAHMGPPGGDEETWNLVSEGCDVGIIDLSHITEIIDDIGPISFYNVEILCGGIDSTFLDSYLGRYLTKTILKYSGDNNLLKILLRLSLRCGKRVILNGFDYKLAILKYHENMKECQKVLDMENVLNLDG